MASTDAPFQASAQRRPKPTPIPERVSSLAPPSLRLKAREAELRQQRHASTISSFSFASSTVSEFLEERVKACEYEFASSTAQLEIIQHTRQNQDLDSAEYQALSHPLLEHLSRLTTEKQLLKKQSKLIRDDLGEEVERKKARQTEPGVDFYERAYLDSIIPRIMGATNKQEKSSFNNARFRDAVLNAYNAVTHNGPVKLAWCHLAGVWEDAKKVKAAHLVPKSLSRREVAYFFGAEEVSEDFFYDWRLGLSLHSRYKEALDQGAIVIVPILSGPGASRWKCVLVDKAKQKLPVTYIGGSLVTWGDLDNKELTFLGHNRPAKRYLYFRFISSIIHAQKTSNMDILGRLEVKEFWASPGEYLRRSTLVTMARQIFWL
ncbi:Pc12g04220 [Talaromyces islandicus]|uniref:Pc12g04220 n=1 Tax=Talaromyces islandicus TaxID=28573 RepID=A0A0U1M540_TALIS|nr:Pc12g04220 [Talaromyces islandicus]